MTEERKRPTQEAPKEQAVEAPKEMKPDAVETKPLDKQEELKYNKKRKRNRNDVIRNKLDIPTKFLDLKKFSYRWSLPSRVQQRLNEDWEVVVNTELAKYKNSTDGSSVKIHGGVNNKGEDFDLILMRKPLDWYNDDKRVHQETQVDEVEKQIVDGSKYAGDFKGTMHAKKSNKISGEE